MDIAKTLARLRNSRGLTQSQVADILSRRAGRKLTDKAVSHWESGQSRPSVELFLLMCDLYRVDDIRRVFIGMEHSGAARLNELGRKRVDEYVSLLSLSPAFSADTKPTVKSERSNERTIMLYDMPASAGTGLFLESDVCEEIAVCDTVPSCVDYALRLSGDSMEPRYADGQIVYVRRQQTLADGDTGIFLLNGDAYCKKLGHGQLISINENYKPIIIHEYDSLVVLGKVVL